MIVMAETNLLDPEKLLAAIKALLQLAFKDQIPSWLLQGVAVVILLAIALPGLRFILDQVSNIVGLLHVHEIFASLLSNPEQRRRVGRRQIFAEHVYDEIRSLGLKEEWRDQRFTELEAEVEAEGQWGVQGILPWLPRSRGGLRRERSLSLALQSSQERLILVEGDPGSGKSIALRHIAQSMAARAKNSKNAKSVIPIYLNLKALERSRADPIDRQLIETFVLKTLNRSNDRDLEEFLDEEFRRGLADGTWLFLFDSFDELPEILSSTEADEPVRDYADAISDFLHGLNQCRGIIASRAFRGPTHFGWPRFRVVQLSEKRQMELVRRADLEPTLESELIGRLGTAPQDIRNMANNPLFLALLCEHLRAGQPFPENAHGVFETYVERRFMRDRDRLSRRFNVEPSEVRSVAESVAYCMAADPGLGLNPTRRDLRLAMQRLGIPVEQRYEEFLDALEYIKLARSESTALAGESHSFTFAHRRFQEYFATCVVLRYPDLILPHQLLTDGRWRETAVVMCQTQSMSVLAPFLDEVRAILNNAEKNVPGLIEKPIEFVSEHIDTPNDQDRQASEMSRDYFPWPSGTLYLLEILQQGFASRQQELPPDIRLSVGRFLLSATVTGTPYDKKQALEVAGIAPQPVLLYLLREAFGSQSQWLREVAYRQVAQLGQIPTDIAKRIRVALIRMAAEGRLHRDRHATQAHLDRLDQSGEFLSVMRLLVWTPTADLTFHVLLVFGALAIVPDAVLIVSLIISHLVFRLYYRVASDLKFAGSFHIPDRFFRIQWSGIATMKASLLAAVHRNRVPRLLAPSLGKQFPASLLVLVVLIYLRAGLVVVLATHIPGPSSQTKGTLEIAYLGATTYGVLWALVASEIARLGRFTRRTWWPLMPVLLIVFPMLGLRWTVERTVTYWRQVGKRQFAKVALTRLGVMSLIVVGVVVYYLIIDYVAKNLGNVGLVAVALSGLGVGLFMILHGILWINDWLRWHKWKTMRHGTLTVEQLRRELRSYTFPGCPIRLLQSVRRDSQISESPESLRDLEALALELDRGEWPQPIGVRRLLKDSLRSAEMNDEAYKLVEQIRRRGLVSPAFSSEPPFTGA